MQYINDTLVSCVYVCVGGGVGRNVCQTGKMGVKCGGPAGAAAATAAAATVCARITRVCRACGVNDAHAGRYVSGRISARVCVPS